MRSTILVTYLLFSQRYFSSVLMPHTRRASHAAEGPRIQSRSAVRGHPVTPTERLERVTVEHSNLSRIVVTRIIILTNLC